MQDSFSVLRGNVSNATADLDESICNQLDSSCSLMTNELIRLILTVCIGSTFMVSILRFMWDDAMKINKIKPNQSP